MGFRSVPATTDLYGSTAYIRDEPQCPANGTYTLTAVDTKTTCTIAGHTL